MELENKTIIHIAQYAAPYEGNFIKSLKFLETSLAEIGCKMAYIFPEKAKEQSWWNDFEKSHTVYTTQNDVKKSSRELYNIFEIERPAIIHTHFEGYDTPAKIASDKFRKKYGFNIQNVWHLHDYFTYVSNPIKKLYQKWCFFNHYCLMAKDVAVIGVCDEVKAFVSVFKKISGNPFYSEITIPNGIDISRISVQKQWSHGVKTFLAYGGRNVSKRIDIILRAFMSFPTPPLLILVKGADTQKCLDELFNGGTPAWCQVIEPSENIVSILSRADCFISSSVHETFSYAICEATIYGIPVIQSDISGTKWNEHNPTSYVFPSENHEALASRIAEVMNIPIEELTQNCRITRENNIKEYSLPNWSKKIIEFYKRL